ncbi:MAG: ATP-binding protein [Archaeoglobaceae archaeon]|nr:ATP-binding protein [Archaeoglobaceae archaeon]
MKKEILKRLIVEFHESELPELIERSMDVDLETRKIISIIGPRRCGKTYYLYYLIKKLIQQGEDKTRMLYINFEDERILPFSVKEFDLILEAYFELYPENKGKKIYAFFDEIQNVNGWEVAVRRMYDREKIRIFITGSNSKLLSKEIATALRGRTISYELQPFSFLEILRAKGIDVTPNLLYSSKRFHIKKLLNEYMKFGGFPEVVLENDETTKIRILQEYLNTIFFRDLVERYSVRNTILLKEIIRFLISNISRYFSVSKFYKLAKQNFKVTKRTILNYCSYLEDVRLTLFVKKFGTLKEQMVNPRKIYCIDVGFKTASGFYTSEDLGRIAENLVFLKLRERQLRDPLVEIYYWKQKQEVDFIVKRGKKIEEIIQVCWDVEEAKEREIKGILNAAEFFKIKKGIIITWDFEGEELIEGVKIEYVPLWKWLLYSK